MFIINDIKNPFFKLITHHKSCKKNNLILMLGKLTLILAINNKHISIFQIMNSICTRKLFSISRDISLEDTKSHF